MARTFRTAVLKLAKHSPFARRMINSGRLSTPSLYAGSPLSTTDEDDWGGSARLGGAPVDAPLRDAAGQECWLVDLLGDGFTAIYARDTLRPNAPEGIALKVVGEEFLDAEGLFAARYDAKPGSVYLFRPDQYLCARLRSFDAGKLAAARASALGRSQ